MQAKGSIHLPRLLEHLGSPVREGKARCLNPEHNDEHPSCGVFYGHEGWKLYCPACGWSGDVFDVLQLLGGAVSFNDAYQQAKRIMAEGTFLAPRRRPLMRWRERA